MHFLCSRSQPTFQSTASQAATAGSLAFKLEKVTGGAKIWLNIVNPSPASLTSTNYTWNGVKAPPAINCGSTGCGLWAPSEPDAASGSYYFDTVAKVVGEGVPGGAVYNSICMSHVDKDGDGTLLFDCRDTDATIHPGATEVRQPAGRSTELHFCRVCFSLPRSQCQCRYLRLCTCLLALMALIRPQLLFVVGTGGPCASRASLGESHPAVSVFTVSFFPPSPLEPFVASCVATRLTKTARASLVTWCEPRARTVPPVCAHPARRPPRSRRLAAPPLRHASRALGTLCATAHMVR